MNILFCSAGRRVELLKDFRKSMDDGDRIVAADLSELAPALYVADAHYLVPRIRVIWTRSCPFAARKRSTLLRR